MYTPFAARGRCQSSNSEFCHLYMVKSIEISGNAHEIRGLAFLLLKYFAMALAAVFGVSAGLKHCRRRVSAGSLRRTFRPGSKRV